MKLNHERWQMVLSALEDGSITQAVKEGFGDNSCYCILGAALWTKYGERTEVVDGVLDYKWRFDDDGGSDYLRTAMDLLFEDQSGVSCYDLTQLNDGGMSIPAIYNNMKGKEA